MFVNSNVQICPTLTVSLNYYLILLKMLSSVIDIFFNSNYNLFITLVKMLSKLRCLGLSNLNTETTI